MADSSLRAYVYRFVDRIKRLTYDVSHQNMFQAAALLIALVAAWPLLSESGLLNPVRGGGDSPFLLQRLQQLETALLDGHFPVRWMPDANYGYGFPFYNFYAPLSIYFAVVFRFIGFSYVRAIQLTQLFGFLAAALGMFTLGRRLLKSDWAGLLASAAYTLAPFHIVNIYVRGDSLAEFWAMAFYPLIILTADDLVIAGRGGAGIRRKIVLFALCYAGLILSHNISAFIFSPFLLLFIFLRWWQVSRVARDISFATRKSLIANLIPTLLGITLALALAANFFLPALVERSLAQLGPVTAGYFHFSNHFRGADLIQSSFLFDYDPAGGRAFHMGLIQVITAVMGCLILGLGFKPRLSSLFVVLTLLIATFMITDLSQLLWDNVPLLPFVQFPWRFLSVQAMATALASAMLARLPGRRALVPAIIMLLLVSSLGRIETAHLNLSDEDVTAEKLAQYEWFTGNIGTTISAEYLSNTVEPRPYSSLWLTNGERDPVWAQGGEVLSIKQVSRKATRQEWQVHVGGSAGEPGASVTFPTLYWAGWSGFISGQKIETRPAPGSGLITVDLPPGDHLLTLRLGRTSIRLISELISLGAVLIAGWLLRPVQLPKPTPSTAWAILLLLLLALGLRGWPERELNPGDLTWDFAQMAYLHHAPEGVIFDDGIVLEKYTYHEDEIHAGETFIVTLTWAEKETTSPTQVTIALTTPAINRFESAPILVSQTQTLRPGQTTYSLSIPDKSPGGLYLPRLTLDEGHALMSAGRPRGDLFLRPVRLNDIQTPADRDAPPLSVRAERIEARNEEILDVQLAWLTQQPLSQNYKFSLRLIDSTGLQMAQFDHQPGYGFLPSNGWPAGRWLNDWLALSLPLELSENDPFPLMVSLYEAESGTAVLTRSLGQLSWEGDKLLFQLNEPNYTLPDTLTPLSAQFIDDGDPVVQLHGYHIEETDDAIDLTLYWEALVDGNSDFNRFVHLIVPDTEQPPLAQSDGIPRYNSYPTGQWIAGEIVADPLKLNLSGLPSGEYQIVVGLYRNMGDSFPRLTSVDGDGDPFPLNRIPLPGTITIEGN